MNSFNFMKDTTEQAKQKLLASNWESMQDADQKELAELNKKEFQKEQDAWRDAGMSWSDFL